MIASLTTASALTPASECIRSTTLSCTARTGGVIEAAVAVSCNKMASELGVVILAIDEYRDGAWVQVASVTNDFLPNTMSYHQSVSYNGTPGLQYRSRATVRALYNGAYEYRYPEKGPTTAIK